MGITFGNSSVSAGLGSVNTNTNGSAPTGDGLGNSYSTERDWRTMVPSSAAIYDNYTPPADNGMSYYQQQLAKGKVKAAEESQYTGTDVNPNLPPGSYDYVNNNPVSDSYQANPYEYGTDDYYNDAAFTMYLPQNPNPLNINELNRNPYMDHLRYDDVWLAREYGERLPSYMDYKPPPAALSHAYGARLGQGESWEGTFDYGYAQGGIVSGYAGGGIVNGYADGGEIIPDKGLSEFEKELVQGAIQALTGAIQDEAVAQEILMELEATFGQGAVEELAREIKSQSGTGDGMDDSVPINATPGEMVVSNPQLADYGAGDREVGAEKLMKHLDDVSRAHRGTAATPKRVDPASLA
jgi:hypothetical protein